MGDKKLNLYNNNIKRFNNTKITYYSRIACVLYISISLWFIRALNSPKETRADSEESSDVAQDQSHRTKLLEVSMLESPSLDSGVLCCAAVGAVESDSSNPQALSCLAATSGSLLR